MRIIRDGTVYRIELASAVKGFETRISHAVNAHGELMRPRLEIGRSELESFFTEALPHIFGHCLVIANEHQNLETQQKIVAGLIRLANEVAVYCTAYDKRRELIPEEVQAEIEMLSAFRATTPFERVDVSVLGAAVSVLEKKLTEE